MLLTQAHLKTTNHLTSNGVPSCNLGRHFVYQQILQLCTICQLLYGSVTLHLIQGIQLLVEPSIYISSKTTLTFILYFQSEKFHTLFGEIQGWLTLTVCYTAFAVTCIVFHIVISCMLYLWQITVELRVQLMTWWKRLCTNGCKMHTWAVTIVC